MRRSRRVVILIVLVALGLGGAWLQFRSSRSPASAPLLRMAFRRGDDAAVLALHAELPSDLRETPELLLMAGESASRLERYDESLQFYQRIPDQAGRHAAVARWAAGEVLLHQKQMSSAIRMMEHAVRLDPAHQGARERLVFLLNLAGRRWDARSHLTELLRQDQWSVEHLLYLGNLAKPVENEAELQEFLKAAPDDRLPLLGLARIRIRNGAIQEADALLADVLQQFPDLTEAHVQLGRVRMQSDVSRMAAWNQALPAAADGHPDIWQIRGEWARDHQQPNAAIRCFGEALLRDPGHQAALNALIPLLAGEPHQERRPGLEQRAAALQQLVLAIEHIMSNEWSVRQSASQPGEAGVAMNPFRRSPRHLEPIQMAAQRTLELGRTDESRAWARYGLSFEPSSHVLRSLAVPLPQAADEAVEVAQQSGTAVDARWLQAFPLPEWNTARLTRRSMTADSETADAARFQDRPYFEEVRDALDFTYFAARDDFSDGRRMFEFTGGGIGILDLDQDDWPDIYLAQGCVWPSDGSDREHSDRLKRNRGRLGVEGRAFDDVTDVAGVREAAFGQGVAVGDVNSDGFDDIYVCQTGLNQLWISQGDGTYSDGSTVLEAGRSRWTVSAAIADLNGDGLAEIFDANYVEGDDVDVRRCDMGGKWRACAPLNFRPARGSLLAADDEGLFRDVRDQVLSPSVQDGNALGLVVFRVQGQKRPSVFVANDQVANLMLQAVPDDRSPLGIRLDDLALQTGLAFDGEGKAQACMGVAAGDVDQNGSMDLLVTNFYDEPNTLYLQQAEGIFRDATRPAGLVAPSLKQLGFGAQFLDVQSDGGLDLVVLNGHIDDMTHMKIPYHMRAQLFIGTGRSQFAEVPAEKAGAWFAVERLGRALAVIDFDQDGHQDLAATDLQQPATLLRNTCQTGNHLTLTLCGTTSHRNAVGADVTATVGNQRWTQQLTAGCGYLVTNERVICFGLGQATTVDELEISWPSGLRQVYTHVRANTPWRAVEGRLELTPLPGGSVRKSDARSG